MNSLDDGFAAIEARLVEALGRLEPPEWSLGPFEAMVFVLIDRLGWNAPRTLDRLRDAGLLSLFELAQLDSAEFGEVVPEKSPASAAKAALLLKRAAEWWRANRLDEEPDRLSTEELRTGLLAIRGIGEATAEAILLGAFRRPAYPLDQATYRILFRHGWIDLATEPAEIRESLIRRLEADPSRLGFWSEAMARLGRQFCRVRVAHCQRCPLEPFLPEGGPVEPE